MSASRPPRFDSVRRSLETSPPRRWRPARSRASVSGSSRPGDDSEATTRLTLVRSRTFGTLDRRSMGMGGSCFVPHPVDPFPSARGEVRERGREYAVLFLEDVLEQK